MNDSGIVIFEDLSKTYGNHIGIKDLNFSIGKGEIFGFLGPNGAGKTTTIRLMLDLIKPSSGSVRLFGLEVQKNALEIRTRIGYLPGNFEPYGKMTGFEFLSFTRSLRKMKDPVPGEYFDVLELSKRDLEKKIRAYSQGMKQKLGIIHALAHEPELIILDEPSTGLDPLMQEALYTLLDNLHSKGCTIFFSSHNLPEVEKICQKVAIVKSGKLVGYESLESLRKHKKKKLKLIQKPLLGEAPELQNAELIRKVVDGFEYMVTGNIQDLLKEISQLDIVDVIFPEPNLEDIFLSYYDKLHKNVDNEA